MPMRDGLRRHRLAEAVLAVDHGEHRRVDHDLDREVGHDGAVLLLRGIARHAHDAVAVVAREVGAHQVVADAAALLRRASGLGKDIRDEGFERLRLEGDCHYARLMLRTVTLLARAWRLERPSSCGARGRDVAAVPGRVDHDLVDHDVRRQAGDVADQVADILRLRHARALLLVIGTGRLSRIGVATSPGQTTQERMPLTHSSMLMVWLIATTPCLAAE